MTPATGSVEAALGGSVAPEELKGDFARAEAAAAAELAAGQEGAAARAALVAALRGEVRVALERLAAAPAGPAAGDARAIAAAAALATVDGAATNALDARTAAVELGAAGRDEAGSVALPASATGVHAATVAALPALRRRTTDRTSTADEALAMLPSAGGAWPFATLASADLCRRAGDHDRARQLLGEARAAYESASDTAGSGACRLAEGDWLAVPAGSLLTLGLRLSESLATESSELHDSPALLLAVPPPDDRAGDAYDRAAEAFTAAGAPRGLAAVALRQACLASLHGDAQRAGAAARDARARFDAAGDARMGRLAAAHVLLADIAAGVVPEDLAAAGEIGAWGRRSGSVAWAVGLGMLFSQAGWRWQRRDGDADRALACHRLAEATFAAAGASLNRQQALGDQLRTHAAAGDHAAALRKLDEAEQAAASLPATGEPDGVFARQGRLHSLVLMRGALAHATQDAAAMAAVRPATERVLAVAREWARGENFPLGPVPPQLLEGFGAFAEELERLLRRDTAFAHVYGALDARARDHRLDFDREKAAALAAAADSEPPGELEAMLLLTLGERDAARAAYEAAAASAELPAGGDALRQQAALLTRLGAWSAARARHEALVAVEGADWATLPPAPWLDVGDLARVAAGLGEHERARELFARALALLEARRGVAEGRRGGISTAAAEARLHGAAARFGAGLGRHDEAFGHAERGRARALLDRMAGGAVRADRGGGRVRRWRSLTARVTMLTRLTAGRSDPALEGELAAAERELDELEVELRASDPQWARAVDPPAAVLDAAGVARRLPDRTLLLAYLVTEDALLGWAITRDGFAHASTSPAGGGELDTLLSHVAIAASSASDAWPNLSERLAPLALAPFDELIAAHDHVVLVPHGRAHLVPLHALPWRDAPLIASKAVSVLPSASAASLVRPPRWTAGGGAAPRLLAVGDPDGMARRRPGHREATGGFARVPWIGAQAAEAAGWFDGQDPLLGPAALEADVVAALPRHDVLHLGTHGELDGEPLLSCVLLAHGDTLDVWELPGLDLEGRLVVLAACNTAGAPTTPGDELVGLGWLALAAGACGVVASLWPVHQLSTALLMRALYGELRDGRPPRVALASAQQHVCTLTPERAAEEIEALRAAAAAAKRPVPELAADQSLDFSHPYHWAGFVLIGL